MDEIAESLTTVELVRSIYRYRRGSPLYYVACNWTITASTVRILMVIEAKKVLNAKMLV
jgi:hypothetical protein